MNQRDANAAKDAAVSEGLSQARRLGNLLRQGESGKRARMSEEIKTRASERNVDAFTRTLATCADASLGDDVSHSDAIRSAANGFRDTVVAHPPDGNRRWDDISDALAEKNEANKGVVPATTAAGCAPAGGFAPVSPQLSLFPTTAGPCDVPDASAPSNAQAGQQTGTSSVPVIDLDDVVVDQAD